jgi:ABC-2 type transport system permease protein
MNSAFGMILKNEARLSTRRATGLVANISVPLVLLLIFGLVPAFRRASSAFGGLSWLDVYVPIIVVLTLTMVATISLPITLISYRERGILRRLSVTPVPPSWLLAAQAIVELCNALVAFIIVITLSVTAFGVPAPKSPAGLVLSFLLAAAGLYAIGLTLAAVIPTQAAASVYGRLVFFPLMFFAGVWLPRDAMPHVLLEISNYTPVGPAVETIEDSLLRGFPPVSALLVLAGYAVVFGYLARRLFRWQ